MASCMCVWVCVGVCVGVCVCVCVDADRKKSERIYLLICFDFFNKYVLF